MVSISFPDQSVLYALQAYNDVRCEEPENMANVAVTVVKNKEEQFYGIFHLHFNHDGSIPTLLKEAYTNGAWTGIQKKDEWREEWCEWIHYVYPEEKEKFKCEQFVFD